MTNFTDDFNRLLADGYNDLEPHAPALGLNNPPDDGPTITVHQATAYLPISMEAAMDAGLMTEAEARARGWTPPPPPPPIPWRTRARWRWRSWRERAGRKIGGWLAGVDLTERDED